MENINFKAVEEAQTAAVESALGKEVIGTIETTEEPLRLQRKLAVSDLGAIMGLVSSIGLNQIAGALSPEQLSAMAEGKTEADAEAVGLTLMMNMLDIVLGNYERAQPHLVKLVCNIFGYTEDEVLNMDPGEFLERVTDIIMDKSFRGFFKQALSLFGKAASALSGSTAFAAM